MTERDPWERAREQAGKEVFVQRGEARGFIAGFTLSEGRHTGTLHTEDIRTAREWYLARAAVDSPADAEGAVVWAEDACDKEIAAERAHPSGTGCPPYQTQNRSLII